MPRPDRSNGSSRRREERAQPVLEPLRRTALALVLVLKDPRRDRSDIERGLGRLGGLVRSVSFRDPGGCLSCIVGIGARAWDALGWRPRPRELHPLKEIRAGPRRAVSTPGDFWFHLRADRMDLVFELARHLGDDWRGLCQSLDETAAFQYFDNRDLLGFVDGTENPSGRPAVKAALIGREDPPWAGGSYVLVQKYRHDLCAWDRLPVEEQERIVGRRKLSDVELPEGEKPSRSHVALTHLEVRGREVQILRYNMPFGQPARGEFGTLFIGYARSPRPLQTMLRRMFVGSPPGNYDRLLDYSEAVTGQLFFVPPRDFLDSFE